MKSDSDRRILEKILHYVSLENKDVLEIGCGNGRITSLLAGKPKHLIAIEPDPEKIKEARKTISGVDFRIGSGENLEFADGCFDLVIFTLSLHHQNSKTAIREAARILRKSGSMLIIEPVNEGEIEQLFSLLRDETNEVMQAQKAIDSSNLYLKNSEVFTAKWIFDDKEDLLQSLFRHYNMPFDADIANRVAGFLKQTLEKVPIVLHDSMVIQVLLKFGIDCDSQHV